MMRVTVQKAEESLGRLCQISEWRCFGDGNVAASLETPMCMFYTIAGHIPHITRDVEITANIVPKNAIYQLTMPTLIDSLPALEEATDSKNRSARICQYVGLPESSLHYLSYNDPAVRIQPGYNAKNSVSIFGRAGRRKVDLPLFERVQRLFQVQCFQSLADSDTPPDAGAKRLKKSVERTEEFAKRAVEIASEVKSDLFLTLAGGHSAVDRMACVDQLADLPCSGYVFEGFHSFGDLEEFQVSSISTLLTKSLRVLPADRLRVFPGALDPNQVMELVGLGIDVFDTSYTYIITEKFLALLVSKDLDGEFSLMDLKGDEFSKDLTPISKECGCYTCKHYTKAYLNHLWRTQELLGPILLTTHNLHQYQEMFRHIRHSLATKLELHV